jgi:hypothetical protein
MKARLLAVAALLCVSLTPGQASTLVDQGNNTYDPNTGLHWLDLTLTIHKSYNEIVANYLGAAQPYQGYRYATEAEVNVLFLNAGITTPFYGPLNSEETSLTTLMSLLGVTNVYGPTTLQSAGLIGTVHVPGTHDTAYLYIDAPNNLMQGGIGTFVGDDEQFHGADFGSFLVATTPLPAALPLFATGLGALGLLGWRRKRKAAQAAA